MVWVNGIIAGVHEIDWASEGVEVLMNDVWNSPVIEFGYVSSRTQWIKLKKLRVALTVEAEMEGQLKISQQRGIHVLGALEKPVREKSFPVEVNEEAYEGIAISAVIEEIRET